MKYYLYRHIRLDTNDVFYIGIGTKINKEFYSNHKQEFYRAYRKSDRNNFWNNIVNKTEYEIEIILESDNYEFVKEKEIEFIKLYGKKISNNGTLVNITDGGEGVSGTIISKEHRKKISDANKEKIPWNKNMKMSEEHKRILSEAHLGIGNKIKGKSYEEVYGIERAKEIKEKLSIKGKTKTGESNNFYGKKHSEDYKIKRGRPTLQFDLEGNFIEKYYSMTEAANITNSYGSLIQKVCKGDRKTHNGFIWKYEDIENSRINSYK